VCYKPNVGLIQYTGMHTHSKRAAQQPASNTVLTSYHGTQYAHSVCDALHAAIPSTQRDPLHSSLTVSRDSSSLQHTLWLLHYSASHVHVPYHLLQYILQCAESRGTVCALTPMASSAYRCLRITQCGYPAPARDLLICVVQIRRCTLEPSRSTTYA
jgi:hypothetical protein